MIGPRAIETVYKGCRFRSRLEARWAVFFDALGIPWEYEAEGYVLADGTWYLPDFWLPGAKLFVEIKPGRKPSEEEETKCRMLACLFPYAEADRTNERDVLLITGEPWPDSYDGTYYIGLSAKPPGRLHQVPHMLFRSCDPKGTVFLESDIHGHPMMEECDGGCVCLAGTPGPSTHGKHLLAAYNAARGARFEHGQQVYATTREVTTWREKLRAILDEMGDK